MLSAAPDVVFMDPRVGNVGSTTIEYIKGPNDKLASRVLPGAWAELNENVVTGVRGDSPLTKGTFVVNLAIGNIFEVAIFPADWAPNRPEVEASETLRVYCLRDNPAANLITEGSVPFGGTWLRQGAVSPPETPTYIVMVAASRNAPVRDRNGYPRYTPVKGFGEAKIPNTARQSSNHAIEITGLFAGQRYFTSLVVTDGLGNWEDQSRTLTLQRRNFEISFDTLTILNDGDPNGNSNPEFTFEIFYTEMAGPASLVKQFHIPQRGREWAYGGQAIQLALVYQSDLQVVHPWTNSVSLLAFGKDPDWVLEDEVARSFKQKIDFPTGRGREETSGETVLQTHVRNGDFEFKVKVKWSVSYAP